ncbi:hypothetical protein NAV11_20280 [Pseudomonas songnenensis]|uniref:Uncharacterized protein n=1 Tax=Pseudomonas songnenensis TaxID=1176259 RepID=A0ABX9UQS0_9PSED|nr:hypothetical protein [Pseudomonas songnenensis]MCQ4302258.1 hypothetical protein [Pseudomonas songnenensis]RMH95397.1 hypothetical protein EA798_16520 [Pseudomonas songnenensis]
MHTDTAIAEFEAWWQQQLGHTRFEDVKDQMRNVWVASRAELVIELPDGELMDDGVDEWGGRASILMLHPDECRAAIEAAGVTVRG